MLSTCFQSLAKGMVRATSLAPQVFSASFATGLKLGGEQKKVWTSGLGL